LIFFNTSVTARILLSGSLIVAPLTLPSTAFAEWSGDIEGGTIIQGDNKGTRLRLKASNNARPLSQTLYADWLRGDDKSNTYEAGYQPKFWFSNQTYAFGEGSYATTNDETVDSIVKLFAGIGLQLLASDSQSLFIEAGAGQTTVNSALDGVDAESNGSAIGRLGGHQVLSDLLKFEIDADYTTTDDLVQTSAEAGIALRITGGSIKYSYRVRGSKLGDADTESVTDSSVSFQYGF